MTLDIEGTREGQIEVDAPLRNALLKCAPHAADERYALKIGDSGRMAVKVGKSVFVKYVATEFAAEIEIANMRFVQEKTTIPIPKVFGTHTENGRTLIVLEYVEGSTLDDEWPRMDKDQKDSLILELKSYVDQLQAMRGSYIGSVGRKPCMSAVFADLAAHRPTLFETEKEFNNALVEVYSMKFRDYFGVMLSNMLRSGHRIVFAHGDLNQSNIIVRNGRIAAVIDWEMAGYYPEYWEYAQALILSRWESDWPLYLQNAIPAFLFEANVISIVRSLCVL